MTPPTRPKYDTFFAAIEGQPLGEFAYGALPAEVLPTAGQLDPVLTEIRQQSLDRERILAQDIQALHTRVAGLATMIVDEREHRISRIDEVQRDFGALSAQLEKCKEEILRLGALAEHMSQQLDACEYLILDADKRDRSVLLGVVPRIAKLEAAVAVLNDGHANWRLQDRVSSLGGRHAALITTVVGLLGNVDRLLKDRRPGHLRSAALRAFTAVTDIGLDLLEGDDPTRIADEEE